jgi:uncharacterized protein (TIGR00730 family)
MIDVKNECDISPVLRPFRGKLVTIFGSARVLEDSHHYKNAYAISKKFAEKGFKILTGGGGGIMEAGNRGAFEIGTESIGLNVRLPHEQNMNQYVSLGFHFYDYALRKEYLMKYSQYFVIAGGGFGTFDEVGEVLEKLQHNKLQNGVKIFFLDIKFHQPIKNFLQQMLNEKMICEKDLENIHFVNGEDELFSFIP